MRFDCGETLAEKEKRLAQWHRWFAWHPVRISDHDCRWLEAVERRGLLVFGTNGQYWFWQYRPISE